MATKAQEFRSETERKRKPKKPMHTPHQPEAGRLSHNQAHRAEVNSTYAIELSGGHPSRKSTRGSANRSKSDNALRMTARVRNDSPAQRSARKNGRPR